MKAGMDVARLNFSHGSHEEHGARLDRIRAASKVSDKPVAVLQDLCGPKIRAGRFNRPKPEFLTGSTAFLVESGVEPPEDPQEIPVQYEGLASDLQPGDRVLVDDGQNILSVLGIEGERVKVSVVAGGILRDRVGISLPSRRVRLSTLTEKDKADLAFGLSIGRRLRRAELRAHGRRHQARARDHARRGVARPPSSRRSRRRRRSTTSSDILRVTDAVMVARGDLGVELGPEHVPILQREILGIARVTSGP
jgi:pyruvate kinase